MITHNKIRYCILINTYFNVLLPRKGDLKAISIRELKPQRWKDNTTD